MKREFLKSLGLTDEQIDSIMSENGKDIEKHKAATEKSNQEIETLKTELTGVKTQLNDANIQIQGFKDMDIEGIKKSADEWKTKYEADTAALKQEMEKKEYDFNIEKFIGAYEFTSDFAKKAFVEEFKAKEFKVEEGKFLGADDFIKNFKETNKGVFKDVNEADSKGKESNKQSTYQYEPKGGQEGGQDLAAQALNAVLGI